MDTLLWKLSKIDFLIRSESKLDTYSISNCISSSYWADLCKKAVSVSNKFCLAYNLPPSKRLESNEQDTSQAKRVPVIRTGRPTKPTFQCFTCLTVVLDILMIDLKYFWMVGALKDGDCF